MVSKTYKTSEAHRKKLSEAQKKAWKNGSYKDRKTPDVGGDNNPFFGKKHTPETILKIKEARAKQVITKEHKENISKANRGIHFNPNKDMSHYNSVHYWVKKNKPKSKLCEHCKKVPPTDLANISGEYKRDINDFLYLCRKCHMIQDGRLKN